MLLLGIMFLSTVTRYNKNIDIYNNSISDYNADFCDILHPLRTQLCPNITDKLSLTHNTTFVGSAGDNSTAYATAADLMGVCSHGGP